MIHTMYAGKSFPSESGLMLCVTKTGFLMLCIPWLDLAQSRHEEEIVKIDR
jgi:hypothetical protein